MESKFLKAVEQKLTLLDYSANTQIEGVKGGKYSATNIAKVVKKISIKSRNQSKI